jgi:hypothetical protein
LIREAAAWTSASWTGVVIFEELTRVSINSHKIKRIGPLRRNAIL